MDNQVWIIYGLGNKDTVYKNTYHNLGWLFLDALAEKQTPKENWQPAYRKQFLTFKINPDDSDSQIKLVLVKRDGYMNESGNSLKPLLNYLKTDVDHLIVVHDDTDLPLLDYKFSWDKNTAGHKGVLSISQNLQTKAYWRLRLGSRPLNNNAKAMDFVLKKLSLANLAEFKKTVPIIYTELLKKITEIKKAGH